MTAMKTYSVIQRNPNSWNASTGEHEIMRECGHRHKTIKSALLCFRKLSYGRIEDNDAKLPIEDINADALIDAELDILTERN